MKAVFVGYTLDLGQFEYLNGVDWVENPSAAISRLKTKMGSRLTALTNKLTGTLRDTVFKAINQHFYGTNSGVNSTLKTYSNYGLACAKFGSSVKRKSGIKFASQISDEYSF